MQGIPGVSTSEGANEFGVLCAYCEGPIRAEGHIEHFRRKNPAHHPELTFDWDNLFLACGSFTHCGHYKDGKNSSHYDPNELIKPDKDDPTDFLFFSSMGSVSPRPLLDAARSHRAKETIRVFNLEEPGLVEKRRNLAQRYLKKQEAFFAALGEIIDDPDEQEFADDCAEEFFRSELVATQNEPYRAVILDLLKTKLPEPVANNTP
nr:retron system putative HNH endonuclease [Clavibacter michiganensis]